MVTSLVCTKINKLKFPEESGGKEKMLEFCQGVAILVAKSKKKSAHPKFLLYAGP